MMTYQTPRRVLALLLSVLLIALSFSLPVSAVRDDLIPREETLTIAAPLGKGQPFSSLARRMAYHLTTETLPAVTPNRNGNVFALMYHDLNEWKLLKSDHPSFCTTDVKFEQDILDLLDLGLLPLSLEQYVKGEYHPDERYFIITFDDGYLSNYTLAYPILRALDVPADIFVIVNSVETLANHFNYEQAAEMEESGLITIYSHTLAHTSFGTVPTDDFITEVMTSMDEITRRLPGNRLPIFAYPGGVYSKESVERLNAQGVALQLVQQYPADWDGSERYLLRRLSIAYETDVRAAAINFFTK